MRSLILSLVVLVAGPAHAGEPKPMAVYVLDPSGGLPDSIAATVVSAIAQAAQEEGLTALTRAETKALLEQAVDLNKLGSDDSALALAALGKAAEAKYLIASTLSAEGDDTVLLVKLVDVEKVSVAARRQVRVSEFSGSLVDATKSATRLVLSPLFAELKGQLELVVSEEGANVLLDGEQVGVAPLAAFAIPGGHHLVTVTKEGFVRFQETLKVSGGDVVKKMVDLAPSLEFATAYRERNGLLRTLAWVTTGAGVALLGGSAFLAVKKGAQDDESRRLFREYDGLTAAEQLARKDAYDGKINDSKNAATTLGFWAVTTGIAGGVAALLSGGLWLFGDDPERYARFEAREGAP